MAKFINLCSITLFFVLTLISLGFSQTQTEQLVITTYYPSPYGSYRNLYVSNNLGIGTTAPGPYGETLTTVSGSAQATNSIFVTNDYVRNITGSAFHIAFGATGGNTYTDLGSFINGGAAVGNLVLQAGGGNVGIGTTPDPSAKLDVAGTIYATLDSHGGAANMRYNNVTREIFYDVAELFDVEEDVEPGDVLCITNDRKLKKANKSYDTSVAGIVSEAPAILFEGSRLQVAPKPFQFAKGRKPPVALAGRVLCKVTTAKGGPIKIGDLLVTSAKPGYAMKGDPNKIKIGTVLGKAMEPLEKGEGKITVLATLQ
jgi:hypothetical protein